MNGPGSGGNLYGRKAQPAGLGAGRTGLSHEAGVDRAAGIGIHPAWDGPPVGGVEMWAECLEANDGVHFRAALLRYWARWRGYVGIYRIMDHGPSHGAAKTQALCRELRDPYTPPRASWLNQAELLLGAFRRGGWGSRQALIDHIMNSVREYNEFFAHPFRWSWTSQDLRHWVERKHLPIGCNTSATRH
jgi:hypothetical protein